MDREYTRFDSEAWDKLARDGSDWSAPIRR